MRRSPALGFLVVIAYLSDTPGRGLAQAPNPLRSPALLALSKRVDIPKDHKTVPLKETLAVAGRLFGVRISLDEATLKPGQKLRDVEDHAVRLPQMYAVLLADVLRHVTRQVGASYRIRGDQIVLVMNDPGANFATAAKTPLQVQLESLLSKQLALKVSTKKADNVPFDDAVYGLARKFRLNVLVDAAEFDRVGRRDVHARPVNVPEGRNVALSAALNSVLVQAGARYRMAGNVLWIEPAGK